MKIAFDVMKVSGFSGNQVYTNELIKALIKAFPENQYCIITHWHTKKGAQDTFGNSLSVRYWNMLPGQMILGKILKNQIVALNDYLQAAASGSFDLYHCTNPMRFPNRIKNVVVTLHDLIALRDEPWASGGSRRFYQSHIERILDQARVIFTVSDYTRQDAAERFPSLKDKFVVTPLAANPVFKPLEAPDQKFLSHYKIPQDKPFLLFIGEIQPRKNIFGAIQAFEALPESVRKEVNFVVVGRARYRENQEEFDAMVAGLKSRHQIFQVSNVPTEDLVRFYNAALGFVYLSFFEGFGLPVIEAMSSGCPVITSNTTSLREVSEQAALSVNPNDQEEVCEAMRQLIEQDDLRKLLRQKGLQRAREFSWEKTAQKTMAGYRKALEMMN
ncbi:MAG: glycosyltransferase family 4 protein [Chlorobiales bacterium]|nr:glycosyltransferase family 4 protein [Chlorobiales bacterium]